MLTISMRSIDFALKLLHFSNFSNFGNILTSLAWSEFGAVSIAEAKHSATPICAGKFGSLKRASERGFKNELNGEWLIFIGWLIFTHLVQIFYYYKLHFVLLLLLLLLLLNCFLFMSNILFGWGENAGKEKQNLYI